MDRNRNDARPSGLDIAMGALASALVGGFYIDLWAHSHGRVDDTFLTPWHAILYAAALAIGTVLLVIAVRARARGRPWREVLPDGYGLSLIGAALFLVAGVFDLIWHEIFGFETSIEDLLSPTHLLLGTAGVFMVAGPVRSAWSVGIPRRFPQWAPWALSLMAVFSVLTAFTSYAHPALTLWPTVGADRSAERSALVVVDISTRESTRLNIDTEANVWMPDAQSNGSIVATVAVNDEGRLVGLDPGFADPRTIWEGTGRFLFADVSTDNSKIAFTADTESGTAQIFTIPVEGGEATQLTQSEADNWDPSWSPNGESVAFTTNEGDRMSIWVVSADGGDQRPLIELASDARAPSWSPDGSTIVFESSGPDRSNLYLRGVDGGEPVPLTRGDWFDRAPSWSPDGATIVFASDRDGNMDLYTVPATGGESTRIVALPNGHEGWAGTTWMPDGSTVVANSSGWNPAWLDEFNARVRGVAGALLQATLLAGLLLLILRRGPLPVGVFSTIFVVNAALMTLFDDHYWYVVPAAITAVAVEGAVASTHQWDRIRRARLLATGAPLTWYAAYLATVAVAEGGIVWSPHLVFGAPVLAGFAGLLLSLVVFPPTRDTSPA